MSWKIEKAGQVAIVHMNSNPMNVMNEGFFDDLEEAFRTLESVYPKSPVVLASSERAFSAGLDIEYHFSLFTTADERSIWRWYERFKGALLRVFTYEMPVIASVSGHAIAGGLILALCCDYRICVDSGARFGLNEVTIGFPLPCAVAQIVLYVLGTAVANRVIATGLLYETQDALKLGFFDESCEAPKLLSRCVGRAKRYDPSLIPGYVFSKKALRREVVENIERVCADADRELPAVLRSQGVRDSLSNLLEALGKKKR